MCWERMSAYQLHCSETEKSLVSGHMGHSAFLMARSKEFPASVYTVLLSLLIPPPSFCFCYIHTPSHSHQRGNSLNHCAPIHWSCGAYLGLGVSILSTELASRNDGSKKDSTYSNASSPYHGAQQTEHDRWLAPCVEETKRTHEHSQPHARATANDFAPSNWVLTCCKAQWSYHAHWTRCPDVIQQEITGPAIEFSDLQF